jgi:hypothetical protein
MNSQLVTLKEAEEIASQLTGIGGGVLPFNDDPEKSGIYIPPYGGPYTAPEDGEKKFYHFRFRNGAEGFNAGLVKALQRQFRASWPLMLAGEVNAAVEG